MHSGSDVCRASASSIHRCRRTCAPTSRCSMYVLGLKKVPMPKLEMEREGRSVSFSTTTAGERYCAARELGAVGGKGCSGEPLLLPLLLI